MISSLYRVKKWMGLMLAALLVAGLALPAAPAAQAATDGSNVVISQLYGGGGNSGAEYKHDFIELYNPTDAPIDLNGWKVRYASKASALGDSSAFTTLTGTIRAKGYYLIQQAAGANGTKNLPTPDDIGTLAMSGTDGKVDLVQASGAVVDMVGYGGASTHEGTGPTAVLSNTRAAVRHAAPGAPAGSRGLDTNNNAADFFVAEPDPRNSSYGFGASSVTADPAPGAWPAGTQISLSSPTVGASVYADVYTAPGAGSGFGLYTSPILLDAAKTIKAYAAAPGYADSPVSEFDYTILAKTDIATARMAAISQNVYTEGIVTHVDGQEVYIQDSTGGLVLYGYPAFAEAGDRVYAQGSMVHFNQLQELKPLPGLSYGILQKQAGVPAAKLLTAADLSAANGEQHEAELVYMENVKIESKNGSTVTASQGGQTFTIYSGLAALQAGVVFERITGVIKQYNTAYQFIPLNENALVENAFSVVATPGSGPIVAGNKVTLSSPTAGAAIYYTVDGTEPTAASAPYTAPIPVNGDMTIKAIVVLGAQTSDVYSFSYVTSSDLGRIHHIQGEAHASKYAGQEVKDVEGIVTQYGYTFANGAYKGFFMQDPAPDDNINTSEGIFVFSTNESLKPAIGDLVKVTGKVSEYNEGSGSNLTSTQITMTSRTIVSSGNPLPAPVILGKNGRTIPSSIIDNDGLTKFEPAEDAIDFFESLEGMRVQLQTPTILSPYWTSGSGDSQLYNIPTRVENDDADVITPAGGLVLKELGNLNPQRLLIAYGNPGQEVNTGDRFAADVTGVIGYNNGNFKVIPAWGELPAITGGTFQRETTTLPVDADKLTIATYNIENFNPNVGAEKINKIAESIVENMKTPDIVAVVEMQDSNGETNNGEVGADQSAASLIAAIQAAGGPVYTYTDIAPVNNQDGGAPGGNIRVGFLYNPARVTLSDSVNGAKGSSTTAVQYDGGADKLTYNPGRIDPTHAAFNSSRKPLAAQFDFKGEKVIVIANHFNSKSGDSGPFANTQPPVLSSETQRHQIAAVVNGFVKDVLAANPKANIVALGDLNDFQFTRTADILKGNELDNLIDKLPLQERYTYTFDGNSQVLDHILVSKNLSAAARVDIVHLNADFSPAKGRASDHDAVLAQLDLGAFPLTVLHTNDTHANLDTVSSPNNILRRITAIKEAKASSVNPILLDAGDVFSGTLYFNKYLGQADLEFMNMAGYDAMTFGNHEFDKDSQVLASFIAGAKFPFVSSNLDFSADAILKDIYKAEIGSFGKAVDTGTVATIYPAIVLNIAGEQVGLFGLTTEDTVNIASPGDVKFHSALDKAKATVEMLQAQGINKIIAITHLGYDEDLKLADAVEGIDIIVGGHSHTQLNDAVVNTKHSAPKLIVQTGEKGQFLGRLEAAFNKDGVLTAWNDRLISIDEKKDGSYVLAEDAAAKAILDTKYKPGIEELTQVVVGYSDVELNGVRTDVRSKETNLGNLIADGMLDAARAAGTDAVIALQNGGGIRASIDQGPISQGEILTVLPFNNDLVTITLTGQEIKEALENGVSTITTTRDGRFPHVAGMRFYYDSTQPVNERVKRVEVKQGASYVALDLAASYTVATNAFTAKGGDFYASLEKAYKEGRVNLLYLPDYEVLTNYLKKLGTVTASDSAVEGRIVDLKGSDLPGEPSGNVKLKLLSVNDLHGKINDSYSEKSLNEDLNGDGVISTDVFVGGMDYMAAALKQRRSASPHTITLHVGDMVGGSPPVSALFQDEPTVEIMEAMGFDVGVVGNHEFDEGTQELLRLQNGGEHPKGTKGYDGQNFPLLAANVKYKDSGKHVLPPYVIKEVEGIQVGFVGVITEETPQIVVPAGIQDIVFTDAKTAANEAVAELKAQGVKSIILLAHIPASQSGSLVSGDAADLAAAVDDEVDVIFAGHNHQRVAGEVDGKLIVQAWEYGKAFGDVDLEIDRATGDIVKKNAVIGYNLQTVYDPAVRAIIEKYTELAAPYLNRVVGSSTVEMKKDYPGMGIGVNGDQALGNLIADGMRANMQADFALMNGGGVRENLDIGDITWGELFSIQPFNNVLVKLEVTGADLEEILNAQLGSGSIYGPDFHVSGFTYTWYRDSGNNRKVIDMQLPDGTPVDKASTYTVVVNNFMHTSTSPKNIEIGKRGKNPITGPEDLEATLSFVSGYEGPIHYVAEGRIRELAEPAGADTTAPVWPGDKSITVSGVSTGSAVLTWTRAADNVAVAGYKLYKGTALAATVTGDVYSFTVSGLSSDTGYTFKVEAFDAAGNETTDGPSVSLRTEADSSGSGTTGGTTTTGSGSSAPQTSESAKPAASGNGVELKVSDNDLKRETTPDGQTRTKVVVSPESLAEAVQALASSGKGRNAVLNLAGVDGAVKVELPAAALQEAVGKKADAVIQVKTKGQSYDLPLSVLKLGELAAQLGVSPREVTISVAIEALRGDEAKEVSAAAARSGLSLLADAISFTITAEAGGKSAEVNNFGATYVTRTITIPRSVDRNQATAVVYDPTTGELAFVPSVFEVAGGRTIVTMKRNSNSIYTVVNYEKTFADLNSHWSQQDVELLASKLVVRGQTEVGFAPDSRITRAEFASLLVRALGLKNDSQAASGMKDVQASDWFAGALGAASKAGLMEGFEDGAFRPEATITREQMAVMISRAMTVAGKSKSQAKPEAASRFTDFSQIQQWAVDAVAESVGAGIVQGTPANTFEPAQSATRAEAAVMLKRLLQSVEFINK
ncbi:5'-nucleotidase C-terminal domain-containing protein [Paenibacillus puerhi]|uniref:5'-nucleotidase C-terminal domain-containing protein n=1 Tax=Paenibacillus puerhi TaxID=2692622 RepID=UPI0013568C91|nr:5'-nucleotidase C-terminal domain-containing protein [Paenibacillus puerhi]